jgi:putative acetyltransferase
MHQFRDAAIRPAVPSDIGSIRDITRAAFGRDEEADLVDRLRGDGDAIVELVADHCGDVVGHIMFSRLAIIRAAGGAVAAASLAPVAIRPSQQRRGIGSVLVREGIEACRARQIAAVVVLGHPDYYPRFGFSAAAARGLSAPFAGPAFMALELTPGALAGARDVRYAAAFGL